MIKHYLDRWIATLAAAMLIVAIFSAGIQAADFTLEWHHDCTDSSLIGYNLYYKAESSIAADLDESVMIYIPLTEEGFDPENPHYELNDLDDDTIYFFTLTAVYEDVESDMSNEVSGFNGDEIAGSGISHGIAGSGASTDASSAGCFIGTVGD